VSQDQPRAYRPANGLTLFGPFLTASEAAARVGGRRALESKRRSLLRIDCPLGLGSAYPAFQFDAGGQTRETAFLAPLLVRRVSHEEAIDWLLRPHPLLAMMSPFRWLGDDLDVRRVIAALPHPSRPVPGIAGVTEAEVLAFKPRRVWAPEAYQRRAA